MKNFLRAVVLGSLALTAFAGCGDDAAGDATSDGAGGDTLPEDGVGGGTDGVGGMDGGMGGMGGMGAGAGGAGGQAEGGAGGEGGEPVLPANYAEGNVDGYAFEDFDSSLHLTEVGGASRVDWIMLKNVAPMCFALQNDIDIADSGVVNIVVSRTALKGEVAPALEPGVYELGESYDKLTGIETFLGANLVQLDDACSADGLEPSAGTVEILEASDDSIRGTFELMVEGETVVGAFDTLLCPDGSVNGDTCLPEQALLQ